MPLFLTRLQCHFCFDMSFFKLPEFIVAIFWWSRYGWSICLRLCLGLFLSTSEYRFCDFRWVGVIVVVVFVIVPMEG